MMKCTHQPQDHYGCIIKYPDQEHGNQEHKGTKQIEDARGKFVVINFYY